MNDKDNTFFFRIYIHSAIQILVLDHRWPSTNQRKPLMLVAMVVILIVGSSKVSCLTVHIMVQQ